MTSATAIRRLLACTTCLCSLAPVTALAQQAPASDALDDVIIVEGARITEEVTQTAAELAAAAA